MTISLFELISVGLIYPFLGILVDFEDFSVKYAEYLEFFGLKGHGEVVLFAGLLLIFTYLFKFFLMLYVNWWKLKIVYARNASLSQVS